MPKRRPSDVPDLCELLQSNTDRIPRLEYDPDRIRPARRHIYTDPIAVMTAEADKGEDE